MLKKICGKLNYIFYIGKWKSEIEIIYYYRIPVILNDVVFLFGGS